ncbi:MAG: divergent polysaccharide deacetylase family protein [Alphaproteobacteria bacterium]|nr:divergent polysaccharide deacetylase family protein [Alphaproteobacteria bacterium]
MNRKPNPLSRVMRSATPALASVIAAAAYGLGAIVFSFADATAPLALPDQVLLQPVAASTSSGPTTRAIITASEVTSPAEARPRAAQSASSSNPAASDARLDRRAPIIALVIDDLGFDLDVAQRVAALEVPLTMAILPYASGAAETAHHASIQGHDVIVHLPMEPLGLADPGPNALQLALSDSDIAARARWALARVPGAVGLNNHMGSRFTQDPRAMRVALNAVRDEIPLYLDSMTTGDSRGAAVARGLGLIALERDIFLDHVVDPTVIASRLEDAERLAELRGWSIAIGHPHDATLEALSSWIDEAQARGVQFVTISALAAHLEAEPNPQIEASLAR